LPGKVPRRGSPRLIAFVVDPSFRQEPLTVHLYEIVLVVAVSADRHAALSILARLPPRRAAGRTVAGDAESELRDGPPASWHVRPRRLDRLAADDLAVADVENAFLGERGGVEVVVLEVER